MTQANIIKDYKYTIAYKNEEIRQLRKELEIAEEREKELLDQIEDVKRSL